MTKKRKTKGKPCPVDIHVGNKLRMRRQILGWSQEKIALDIGLTFQQVQKYEKGMNRISAGRVYQFARILEVPITYFYEGLDMPEASNDLEQTLLTPDNLAHIRRYHGFSKEKKTCVKDLMKCLEAA